MTLVVISVNTDDLPEHTDIDFEEWIKYECGDSGGMSMDNPLISCDLVSEVREIG